MTGEEMSGERAVQAKRKSWGKNMNTRKYKFVWRNAMFIRMQQYACMRRKIRPKEKLKAQYHSKESEFIC